mmetsp:Transcript_13473/g.25535  ORF Transcript_13473/g.25535 Transcript_13473/m.25535 type:complete len:451 (-) Transcript_13473:270-1622(-)
MLKNYEAPNSYVQEPSMKLTPIHTLEGHESLINSCSFSKDGNLIVSSSADGTVRLWHARNGDQIAAFEGHDGGMVQSCAFVPAGCKIQKSPCASDIDTSDDDSDEDPDQPLVISASDEDIKVWGVHDGKEKASMLLDCDGMLQGFALSPDGSKVLSNMDDQCIILSTIRGKEAVTLEGHEGAAKSFCFSKDGSEILTSSTDGSVKLWDTDTGDEIRSFEGHTKSVWKASFSPNNDLILSCSADKSLRLWDRATAKEVAKFEHKSPIHLSAFSDNGRWIASASRDKEIRIWDAEEKKQMNILTGHKNFIWNIQFSPDSMLLLSTSSDGAMMLWAMPTGKLVATLTGHTEGVKSCSFSPKGNALVSSSHDNTLNLWNISGCYYPLYVKEMATFLDNRNKKFMPSAVYLIIAEYTWPDCMEELEIEEEYAPETSVIEESFTPVQRRRIKSCKF